MKLGIGVVGGVFVGIFAMQSENKLMYLIPEAILNLFPIFSGPFAFIRIFYRANFAKNNVDPETGGKLDINPWGENGCFVELIG